MTKYVLRFDGLGSDGLGEILHAVSNLARAGMSIPEPIIEADRRLFDLILEDAGPDKVRVIKAIREIAGLGLKEAKDMVERVPTVVVRFVSLADCDKFEALIVAAGGTVRRSK